MSPTPVGTAVLHRRRCDCPRRNGRTRAALARGPDKSGVAVVVWIFPECPGSSCSRLPPSLSETAHAVCLDQAIREAGAVRISESTVRHTYAAREGSGGGETSSLPYDLLFILKSIKSRPPAPGSHRLCVVNIHGRERSDATHFCRIQRSHAGAHSRGIRRHVRGPIWGRRLQRGMLQAHIARRGPTVDP